MSPKFQIQFLPMNQTIEVDLDRLPSSETGELGSILDIALASDIEIGRAHV